MNIVLYLKLPFLKREIYISKEWMRFGIIFFVVLFTVSLTYWGTSRTLILLILLLIGVVGSVILLQQPNLGFILIFLGGMVVPYSGPAGINAAVFFAAVIVGLWQLDMLVVRRNFPRQ